MVTRYDREDMLSMEYTGQSLEMNYKDFSDFIDYGRSDAYITTYIETEGEKITYIASDQDESFNSSNTPLFSLYLNSGNFEIYNLDAIGNDFGLDRKKAVLAYLSQDKSVWQGSSLFGKVLVVAEDYKGQKCVLKKPHGELSILPKNTDMNKLDDDYIYDFEEAWAAESNYSKKTDFDEPKEIIVIRDNKGE